MKDRRFAAGVEGRPGFAARAGVDSKTGLALADATCSRGQLANVALEEISGAVGRVGRTHLAQVHEFLREARYVL